MDEGQALEHLLHYALNMGRGQLEFGVGDELGEICGRVLKHQVEVAVLHEHIV